MLTNFQYMIMDTQTHGQPKKRNPLVANCWQRHKNVLSPAMLNGNCFLKLGTGKFDLQNQKP